MKLYLLRHGEAGFNAPSDEQRSLTSAGLQQLHLMLEGFSQKHKLSRVIHSPYRRTCETAAKVSELQAVYQTEITLEADSRLVPEGRPQQVIDHLAELSLWEDIDGLMLVTHQPLIGYLTCLLCHGHLQQPEPLLPGELVELVLDVPAAGLANLVNIWR